MPQECPPPSEPKKSKSGKGATPPAVSTSGNQSPAIGPLTQGSGSLAQLGNGNTGSVNNYGPPERHLTDAQRDGLEKIAKDLPFHVIVMTAAEHEPQQYAEEIRQAFLKYGKTEGLAQGMMWATVPYGVCVCINPKDVTDPPSETAKLAGALLQQMTALGLSPVASTGNNVAPKTVEIIVGISPKSP